jgi:hypothetical protein
MTDQVADPSAAPVPESLADLLARIHREWQALQTTVAGASQADLLRPGPEVWSPKDHLAHLAAWLDVLQKHHLAGQPFGEAAGIDLSALGDAYTADDLNALFFERDHHRSLAQVRAWLERSHADTVARLQRMNFTDLLRPDDPDDPAARPLILEVMGNTNEHYQEHNRIIQALLSRP